MSPTAVSVQRGTPFKEIARRLAEYGITAVPVVDDDDRPVGVVSEADLLHKRGPNGSGGTAEKLMSAPAVVARPDWPAVRAAQIMQQHGIKRLPVVDGAGRLAGVISRSDLLRLFLRRDRAIREEIVEDVITRTLRMPPSSVTVDVDDGTVTLSGTVARKSLVPITVRLCESVDGVVEVIDRLMYDTDDVAGGAAAQRPA